MSVMQEIQNRKIEKACSNLKEFIHPQYKLLDCLNKNTVQIMNPQRIIK